MQNTAAVALYYTITICGPRLVERAEEGVPCMSKTGPAQATGAGIYKT